MIVEYTYTLHKVIGKSIIGPDAEGHVSYELEMVDFTGKVRRWVSKEFFDCIVYGDMIETVLRRA